MRGVSLTGRLVLAFAGVSVGILALTWSGNVRLAELGTALDEVKATTAEKDRFLDLRRQIADLQRNVQLYTYVGHGSSRDAAADRLVRLRSAIGTLKTQVRPEDQPYLDRLSAHAKRYQRQFGNAVEERNLRDALVQDSVPKLEARLDAVMAASEARSASAQAVFSAMQLNLRRYLVDPEFQRLLESSEAVARFERTGEDEKAAAALREYERTFTRIVQATRSYLYLVNVVLGAEAMEFEKTADQLGARSRDRAQAIARAARRIEEHGRKLNLVTSVVTLVLTLALIFLIGRSLSTPLMEITDTLYRLGKGERGVPIPGVQRQDEIGVMARAANVFREKNEATAALLEETQRLAASLEEHQRDLERSNDELEEFVHTVSHDLKSPLVTSSGFLGMMRVLANDGDPVGALAKLDKLERANQRMQDLIENLLDLSRVGRVDTERTHLNVQALISELVSDLGARSPKIQFRISELPPVWGNESRILQVFENLLGNAIKYAGESAVIEISGARDPDGTVCYVVRDDGPGVPPEFHETIFGLFKRLDPTSKGTGVGLAIVRRVMQGHEGRAWVESEGSGAAFFVEFPEQVEARVGRTG